MGNTETIQLSKKEKKSLFSHYFGSNRSKRSAAGCRVDLNINEFDKLILACDEYFGEIPPEVSAFIKKFNLRYKDIDCIVFGCGRTVKKAKDTLRNCVSLSGGTVRNIVSASSKELKREEEDIIFSLRHRLAV